MAVEGAYFYDIARLLATAPTLKGTYAGTGDGDTVRPLPENLDNGTPALVLLERDHDVIPGGAERHTIGIHGRLHVARAIGLGRAYDVARAFKWELLPLIRAGGTSAEIAAASGAVVALSWASLEESEWPVGSGRWYFVAPFDLRLQMTIPVLYQPWQPPTP